MKNLVFFTERYPLPSTTEGSFIEPELSVLNENFDRVIIVPTQKENDFYHVSLVNVLLHPFAMVDATKSSFEVDYSWVLWKNHVKERISFERFKIWIVDFIKKNDLDVNETLFYSFWLTQTAEFLGLMALKNRGMKCVARAHRFDIFDMPPTTLRAKGLSFLKAIYPCSRDGARYLKGQYPSFAEKISVQYLGVKKQYEGMNPARADNESSITFFSCHNLIARKRGLLCLQSLVELANRFKHLSFKWILVGDGSEYAAIKERAKTVPFNLRIEMLGALSNSEVQKIYVNHHIDFSVLLSESEGLPVVVLESLAYGVPVITCDVGGTREAVASGRNGILLEKSVLPEDFVEIVTPVLERLDRSELRKNAFATYVNLFDAKVCRKTFVSELHDICMKSDWGGVNYELLVFRWTDAVLVPLNVPAREAA